MELLKLILEVGIFFFAISFAIFMIILVYSFYAFLKDFNKERESKYIDEMNNAIDRENSSVKTNYYTGKRRY